MDLNLNSNVLFLDFYILFCFSWRIKGTLLTVCVIVTLVPLTLADSFPSPPGGWLAGSRCGGLIFVSDCVRRKCQCWPAVCVYIIAMQIWNLKCDTNKVAESQRWVTQGWSCWGLKGESLDMIMDTPWRPPMTLMKRSSREESHFCTETFSPSLSQCSQVQMRSN